MLFVAVGLATALLYVCWVAWAPLVPQHLYVPLLDLGKITGYTWPSAGRFVFLVAALFVLYALGYREVRLNRAPTRLIFSFGVLYCALLIWAYPATAVDVFGYVAHGRLLAVHGLNPFLQVPLDAVDPIVPFLAYPGEPSQYGPVWVLLGGMIALVAHGSLLTEVVLYKLVAATAHLASAALILAIQPRLGGSPTQARAGAFLFLWNPLLLWEMVGNAHNDGAMMLAGLMATWLLLTNRHVLVMPMLVLGSLIKLPLIVLAPLYLIAQLRTKWVAAVEGVALGALLALVVYRPFWGGPETLTALRRTELFTASLGSVVRLALTDVLGLDLAGSVARTLSLALFAAIVSVCLVFAFRADKPAQLVTLGYVILLAAALLATTWFQAWYVVWPFALGAALPDGRRHLEVALLSLGGLLQYLVFIYLWVIGVFPPYENLGVQSAALLAIVGPAVLGLAVWFSVRWAPARLRSL